MTPARGENADSKLYPFPADEGFEKFQKLNFYHLLKGKIHLIVNDKLLILLAACNSSGSWDEVIGWKIILSLTFVNYCCHIVPEEKNYSDAIFLLKVCEFYFFKMRI